MPATLNQLCQILDAVKWKYDAHPEQDVIVTGVSLSEQESFRLMIAVEEQGAMVRLFAPQLLTVVQRPQRDAVLQALVELGGASRMVRWQYDPSDGEVRAAVDIPLEDSQLTPQQFVVHLQTLIQIVGQVVPQLRALAAGGSLPAPSSGPQLAMADESELAEEMQFLGQLFKLVMESNADPTQVYPLLMAHQALFQPPLLRAMDQLQERFQAASGRFSAAEQRALAIAFAQLGDLLREFPQGNVRFNQQWAIVSYGAAISFVEAEKLRASILGNWGNAYLMLAELGVEPIENLQRAVDVYEEAAQIQRQPGLERDLSDILTNWGVAYRMLAELGVEPIENLQRAVDCYREALVFLQPAVFPVDCRKTGSGLGNIGYRQGDWRLAIEGYSVAIAAIEQGRNLEKSEARRQEVMQDAVEIYERMVQACVNAKEFELAWQTVERSRSKRLVDLIRTHDLYQDGEIPPLLEDLLERYATVDQEIDQQIVQLQSDRPRQTDTATLVNRIEQHLGTSDLPAHLQQLLAAYAAQQSYPDLAPHPPAPDADTSEPRQLASVRSIRAAVSAKTAEILILEAVKAALRSQISRYDAVSAGTLEVDQLDLAAVQQMIPTPHAVVLSFYTTRSDTHIFIVRQTGQIQTFTCAGEGLAELQSWIETHWLNAYRQDRRNWQQQMPDLLQELARRLQLNQLIAQHLTDVQELILIPHLLLHLIPFAALPISASASAPAESSPQTLLDRFTLRYLPSCQIWQFCQKREIQTEIGAYGIVEDATDDLPFAAI